MTKALAHAMLVVTVMLCAGCAASISRALPAGSETVASTINDLRDRLNKATDSVEIERLARQKSELDLATFKDSAAGWKDRAEATSREASVLSEQANSLRIKAQALEDESKVLEKKANDEKITAERKLTEERTRLASRFGMALSAVVFVVCCLAAWFLPIGAGKRRAIIFAASMVVLFAVSYSAPVWVPIAIKIGIVVAGLCAVVTVIILIRVLIRSVRSTAEHGDRVEALLSNVTSTLPADMREMIEERLSNLKGVSSVGHGKLGGMIDWIRGKD